MGGSKGEKEEEKDEFRECCSSLMAINKNCSNIKEKKGRGRGKGRGKERELGGEKGAAGRAAVNSRFPPSAMTAEEEEIFIRKREEHLKEVGGEEEGEGKEEEEREREEEEREREEGGTENGEGNKHGRSGAKRRRESIEQEENFEGKENESRTRKRGRKDDGEGEGRNEGEDIEELKEHHAKRKEKGKKREIPLRAYLHGRNNILKIWLQDPSSHLSFSHIASVLSPTSSSACSSSSEVASPRTSPRTSPRSPPMPPSSFSVSHCPVWLLHDIYTFLDRNCYINFGYFPHHSHPPKVCITLAYFSFSFTFFCSLLFHYHPFAKNLPSLSFLFASFNRKRKLWSWGQEWQV